MSDKSETQSVSGGISFTGLLTILFIGLKLGHVINWSWWWVLSPILISFTVVLGTIAIVLLVLLVLLLKGKR